jgi:hypothetical protein
MLKVIHLMKRHRDLSVAQFQAHWLERHARLVAALAGLRRYVQSHALIQGYRKGELLFDGINEHVNRDINLQSLTDIRLYLHYSDFTSVEDL